MIGVGIENNDNKKTHPNCIPGGRDAKGTI